MYDYFLKAQKESYRFTDLADATVRLLPFSTFNFQLKCHQFKEDNALKGRKSIARGNAL